MQDKTREPKSPAMIQAIHAAFPDSGRREEGMNMIVEPVV
jgi:hypothetical protein